MKENKSRAYLVIGCSYAGMSKNILDVLSGVRKFYGAQVVHLGQLTSLQERKVWDNRWENIQTLSKIEEELYETDSETAKAKWRQKYKDRYDKINQEARTIESAQDYRIKLLQDAFGAKNVSFLYNDKQVVPSDGLEKIDYKGEEMSIGRHLLLSCLSANGEKVAHNPISPKSFRYFRSKHKSVIMPHPTPSLRSFNKEGLNQAHVMTTTGSLTEVVDPKMVSEFHRCVNLPSAVIVVEDMVTGRFFLKRLHVDYARDPVSKRDRPFILDDGLRFDMRGEWHELDSDDKGIHSTDDHAPWFHPGVLASFQGMAKLHKPAHVVNGGDAADMSSVSRHNEGRPLDQEGLRLINDLRALKELLDAQANAAPSIKHRTMVDSNHANWLTNFIKKNPMLKGMIDWETISRQWFADWDVYYEVKGDNKIYRFGDLVIRHGHQERGGVAQGSDLFIKYLCGHWHSHNEFLRSVSAGAGCMLGPSYLENGVTSWTNTLTTLQKWKGKASQQVRTVLHDDKKETSFFCYRNKIYQTPWYKKP